MCIVFRIGVRAGGARAGQQPPQILGNSDFLGRGENLGKVSFERRLHVYLI